MQLPVLRLVHALPVNIHQLVVPPLPRRVVLVPTINIVPALTPLFSTLPVNLRARVNLATIIIVAVVRPRVTPVLALTKNIARVVMSPTSTRLLLLLRAHVTLVMLVLLPIAPRPPLLAAVPPIPLMAALTLPAASSRGTVARHTRHPLAPIILLVHV